MLGLAVLALGLAAGTPSLATALHPQDQLQSVFQQSQGSEYFQFAHKIKRVAVIGAGVSGLVGTAVLQDHNLTVRTFERAPKPGSTVSHHFRPFSLPFETLGGNWYFSEETPIAANSRSSAAAIRGRLQARSAVQPSQYGLHSRFKTRGRRMAQALASSAAVLVRTAFGS